MPLRDRTLDRLNDGVVELQKEINALEFNLARAEAGADTGHQAEQTRVSLAFLRGKRLEAVREREAHLQKISGAN